MSFFVYLLLLHLHHAFPPPPRKKKKKLSQQTQTHPQKEEQNLVQSSTGDKQHLYSVRSAADSHVYECIKDSPSLVFFSVKWAVSAYLLSSCTSSIGCWLLKSLFLFCKESFNYMYMHIQFDIFCMAKTSVLVIYTLQI